MEEEKRLHLWYPYIRICNYYTDTYVEVRGNPLAD